jgi:hypothetical protein
MPKILIKNNKAVIFPLGNQSQDALIKCVGNGKVIAFLF